MAWTGSPDPRARGRACNEDTHAALLPHLHAFLNSIMNLPASRLSAALPICCLLLLPGCARFGYYKHQTAEWAPEAEAAKVTFPQTFEPSTRLTGPMLKALRVAMNEFLPPSVEGASTDDPVDRCMATWDTFTASVMQASEELFFVRITPDGLKQCAPGHLVLDGSATYAIDGRGRILAWEQ